MDFEHPSDPVGFLAELDRFIEDKIKTLEATDDNSRFFDYRRYSGVIMDWLEGETLGS